MAEMNFKTNLLPVTTNTYTLGDANHKWKFYGSWEGDTLPVSKGGTGATSAADARTNLGITPANIGAATSGHTHATSLSQSGTATINLAANTVYTLSAGGTSVVFKTPADTNTTYSSKAAASGGTDVSLVTTGEKYTWNNKSNLAIGTTASTAAAGNHTHTTSITTSTATNQITLAASTKYAITAGGTSYVFTTPPNTNTTYSAGTGISLSGTTFSNSGVRSIATGTSNGTISVNTNGTTANVAVKGLGTAAYTASTAYAASSHTHSDADIEWSAKGYKNTNGGNRAIDAGLNGRLGANRFFGIKNGVTVQYSTNGGSSWTTYPSPNIAGLFTTGGSIRIVPSGTTCDANSRLRITIDTSSASVYTDIRKFMIYISTSYSQGCTVTIDAATHDAPTNFSNVICTNQTIAGWSGWNVINTGGLTTYGNTGSQYQMLRFTFANTGMTGSSPTSHGLQVSLLQAYGGVGWTTPSTMALTDHLYSFDTSLNTTFPANLTASKVYGAVWNDYAEYRKGELLKPGTVVREIGDGTLIPTTERLQRGCEIISDTFGFAIGENDECKLPTAAAGRVLAYIDRDRSEFEIGAPVCSGPNGTVSPMTAEEEQKYPSRIIGTVSEIPTYETWGSGNVKVDGRIWIRIR